MAVSNDDFRSVLSHFASGVTLVTIHHEEEQHGLTVSAFASISMEPPIIMVAINQNGHSHDLLMKEGATFAVNLLAADQAEASNRFAWGHEDERFKIEAWTTAVTGAPILSNALAWLDCTVHAAHHVGSHTIFLGQVQEASTPRAGELPLLYWNRGYREMVPPSAEN